MKKIYSYIFIVFLLIAQIALGQSFTTKVSSRTIGKKDLVEVQYVAENIDLSDFVLPKFLGWVVQSGPSFSSNRVQTGSIVKQQIIYSVVLQPLHTGKIGVPAATITIDKNNSRQSNTQTIEVKEADHVAGNLQGAPTSKSLFDEPLLSEDDFSKEQVLAKGENALQKIKANLLVKLDLNKTNCFVGEPIIATYKLCTRLRSTSRVVKQPAFSGCTVTELTVEDNEAKREKIDGKIYNVYVIRKVELLPLQAGTLILPEASVENKVSFYTDNTNYRDLFYNPSGAQEEQQVTLSNKPVTINVKALPEQAPAGFSGAVGKFHIDVMNPSDKPLTTNSTSLLKVVIEGEGNLQQIKTPAIQWQAGIESFEPTDSDEVDKNIVPTTIRKTFTYPFVVNEKGNYNIPAISFCYFDPQQAKYITVATQSLSFAVKKGSNKIISSLLNINANHDFQTRLYIILAIALVAMLAGLFWYNRKYKLHPTGALPAINLVETIEPDVIDTAPFIHNIRHLDPHRESASFYKQLHHYLVDYLKAKFNLSEDGIKNFAGSHYQQAAPLRQLKTLLSECSLGMYTPVFDSEEAMKHKMIAIELLCQLDNCED